MKAKLFNNFGLKLLAVFIACVLWLVVMNISDDQVTKEINDIPVTQINGDVLEQQDQIYDVAKGDTVDIVIKGRRSVVSNLTASDFTATADLSQMSITNSVQINVEANRLGIRDEISVTVLDNMMTLNLEDKVAQQFPVKVRTEGTPRTGFAVGSAIANPNIITIEGPRSTVEKITEVAASVSVAGSNESISTQGAIRIYDAYGEEIKSDKLTISAEMADVSVAVYPTKEVPLTVEIQGAPAAGYAVEKTLFQPDTVTIAGPESELSLISGILIKDISVAGLSENVQKTVSLANYLPESVVAVGDNTEVVVNVTITPTSTRQLTILQSTLKLSGRQNGYTYKVKVDGLKADLSGFEDVIGAVTVDDLAPTIDCSALAEGNNLNVPVIVAEIEGVEITLSGEVEVEVTKDKEEE